MKKKNKLGKVWKISKNNFVYADGVQLDTKTHI